MADSLSKRVQRLSAENSRHKLILGMYEELITRHTLDDVIDSILNMSMELHGGHNVILFYQLHGQWQFRDIYGANGEAVFENESVVLQSIRNMRYEERAVSCEMADQADADEAIDTAIPFIFNDKVIAVLLLQQRMIHDDSMNDDLMLFGRYASFLLYDKMQSYYQLQEAHDTLERIFQNSPDAMCIVGSNRIIERVNTAFLKQFECSVSEVVGQSCCSFLALPECTGTYCPVMAQILQSGRFEAETVVRRSKDRTFSAIISSNMLKRRDEAIGMVISIKDITTRKTAEEQVRRSLKEKETLLKELYHRTKNNMQVIASFLALSGSKGPETSVEQIVSDMQNRIYTMALVHEKLYQSQDLSKIQFDVYLRELVELLFKSSAAVNSDIGVHYELDAVSMLIDSAIPCGLVINEIVSNVFKHAFPDNARGHIRVLLKKGEDGKIGITVSDNGKGLPPGFDVNAATTLGLQTVKGLVEEQLNGVVRLSGRQGTTVEIEFYDDIYQERV